MNAVFAKKLVIAPNFPVRPGFPITKNYNRNILKISDFESSVEKAVVLDGINVIGYLSWGPIDIVSAGTGEMKKRYGYIYVDLDDEGKGSGKRLKKDSFYWYKNVISSGGETLD